jgi:hypothetical protein
VVSTSAYIRSASTAISTSTTSPSSLPRRTLEGTGRSHPADLSRQTLVSQVCPSTVVTTGTRPNGPATDGACSSGTGANTQAAGPDHGLRVASNPTHPMVTLRAETALICRGEGGYARPDLPRCETASHASGSTGSAAGRGTLTVWRPRCGHDRGCIQLWQTASTLLPSRSRRKTP